MATNIAKTSSETEQVLLVAMAMAIILNFAELVNFAGTPLESDNTSQNNP